MRCSQAAAVSSGLKVKVRQWRSLQGSRWLKSKSGSVGVYEFQGGFMQEMRGSLTWREKAVTGIASELVYVAVMFVVLVCPGTLLKANETLMPSLLNAVMVGNAGAEDEAAGAPKEESPKDPKGSNALLVGAGAAEEGPLSRLRISCERVLTLSLTLNISIAMQGL